AALELGRHTGVHQQERLAHHLVLEHRQVAVLLDLEAVRLAVAYHDGALLGHGHSEARDGVRRRIWGAAAAAGGPPSPVPATAARGIPGAGASGRAASLSNTGVSRGYHV